MDYEKEIKYKFNLGCDLRQYPHNEKYYVSEEADVFFINKKEKICKVNISKQLLTPNKYVRIFIGDKSKTLHSVVCETFYGVRPHKNIIMHLDDNKQNNHVNNLKYGSYGENSVWNIEGGAKKQKSKHLYNHIDLKTKDDILAYLDSHQGESQDKIAKLFGVSQTAISSIKNGKYLIRYTTYPCDVSEKMIKDKFGCNLHVKQVCGYDRYFVSDCGRVFSMHCSRVKELAYPMASGYKVVRLYKNDKCKNFQLHHLVLMTFKPSECKKDVVRHLDGDKSNNRLENLCYGSYKDNAIDSVHHKTKYGQILSVEQAQQIKLLLKHRSVMEISKELELNYNIVYKIYKEISFKEIDVSKM